MTRSVGRILGALLGAVGVSDVWAQAAPGAPDAPSTLVSMAPLLLVFAVFYFLLIRPQQKRMKDQEAMITSLKTGDEVMTSSGILGRITNIADKVATVEIADSVRIKMLKSQIAQVVKGPIQDLPEVR